ncbi:hypothetical protein B9Z55_019263 [Caenorhabditis nigoni]|nr:hypothetical protein B9Z55_019263 [Caenorhabditis nigoni]
MENDSEDGVDDGGVRTESGVVMTGGMTEVLQSCEEDQLGDLLTDGMGGEEDKTLTVDNRVVIMHECVF